MNKQDRKEIIKSAIDEISVLMDEEKDVKRYIYLEDIKIGLARELDFI